MNENEIRLIEALRQLDPNNPDHWLPNGQARMEAVEYFAGTKKVNRVDIDALVPGFSRANTALPGDDPEVEQDDETSPEEEVAPEAEEEEISDEDLEDEELDEGDDIDQYDKAVDVLKEAEAILNKKRGVFDVAKNNFDKAAAAHRKLSIKVERLRPQTHNQELIQNYLKGQVKLNEQKADFQRQLQKEGLGAKAMLTLNKMLQKAPIDQVRVRAKGLGYNPMK
jgi:hypothetical protein